MWDFVPISEVFNAFLGFSSEDLGFLRFDRVAVIQVDEQATATVQAVNIIYVQWVQVTEIVMKQAQRQRSWYTHSIFMIEWLKDLDLKG